MEMRGERRGTTQLIQLNKITKDEFPPYIVQIAVQLGLHPHFMTRPDPLTQLHNPLFLQQLPESPLLGGCASTSAPRIRRSGDDPAPATPPATPLLRLALIFSFSRFRSSSSLPRQRLRVFSLAGGLRSPLYAAMITSLRLKRAAALNRISLVVSLTAGDRTAGASSSYSSLSHAQDRRLLQPRNDNHAILAPSTVISQQFVHGLICSPMVRACFSSEAADKESTAPSEVVADLYQRMLKSVEEARSMPPNANLWSLVENCTNREDIKLLFQILERLRVFRLSNLRIHANFNCHLCMSVTKACTRADVPDYGMKALWNHNVYGLTPSIASAHYLLLHAKEKNDASLMVKIMQVMKKNSLPLQPGTADIVFSICYNTNDWASMKKYSRRFLKAGVKLHRTAFDIWMEFAAKRGDAESIWKIEKLRSKAVKKHTIASGFSCAKGYLIERNPESAASAINLMYQILHLDSDYGFMGLMQVVEDLPDKKKAVIADELEKLVVEWSKQVIKRQKKDDREALAEALKSDISAMAASLLNMGIDAKVNVRRASVLTGEQWCY